MYQQSGKFAAKSSDAAPDLGQRKGKGRGPARPNAKWGTGEKLVIELNGVDIPIGDTTSPLQSQLGILARNKNKAERIWAEVKRPLEEGASQIPPDSLERAALREELFTEVLKPDRNGWLHTYGLGPRRSQVFGTRHTRSQDQRIKDQLRAEVRHEVLAEVYVTRTQVDNM